jgi:hypothetical protein
MKLHTLDFTRLLGFSSVADRLSNGVDFQDETLGAKLGAKIGLEPEPVKHGALDFTQLLGFEAVADKLSAGVDFQDETISAKLGAKVGGEIQDAE